METSSNQSSSVPKIVGGIVAVLVCCACALIVGAAFVIYRAAQKRPSQPYSFRAANRQHCNPRSHSGD